MATVSTDSTYTFTVTGNRALTAVFEPLTPHYTITIIIDPPGSGAVTGAGYYESGQAVTLAYTAADNYNFSGWYNASGELLSTSNPYTFTATENLSITAKAVYIPVYTITASIDPAGAGTVTGTGQYQDGTTVTLTAEINDGYKFTGWQENGETVSTENPYTFTATADRAFTAAFAEKPASRLPDGYTELEYIGNPNLDYIRNFGMDYTYNRKYRVELDVYIEEDLKTTSNYVIGTNSISTYTAGKWFQSAYLSYNKQYGFIRFWYGASSTSSTSKSKDLYTGTGRLKITIDPFNGIFKANDLSANYVESTITVSTLPPAPALFAANIYSKTTATGKYNYGSSPANMKLYSLKFYSSDGSLYREYVPCRRESDGKLGVFAIQTETFYGNYGTAGFSAGPAV